MDQSFRNETPIKSALFVDFDNIYIGLSKSDPQAAERFASDPARWLGWLEKGYPVRNKALPPRPRSVLIRRCYPNPDAGFRRFRSFFTSAAFSVIDCPSQTRTGKNSSDIYMVMDILDTLNHKTNFDEFIILSGDSDFMPVLLRLRAYDRRTTTLAIDFMPPAYKAACDLVITEEEFIEDALGISHDSGYNAVPRSRVPAPLLKEMAARVMQAVSERGEVAGADLPDILKDFREFRESNNWLGFGTSQRLADALVCYESRLYLVQVNPMMYKVALKPQVVQLSRGTATEPTAPAAKTGKAAVQPAKRVTRKGKERPSQPEPAVQPAGPAPAEEKAGRLDGKQDYARLRSQIIAVVKETVSAAPSAILLARASQLVVNRLGPQVLETQWAGAGSFKRLLQTTENLGLEITTQPEPGYIYDPRRHSHPALVRPEEAEHEAAPYPAALEIEEHAEPAIEPEPVEEEGQRAMAGESAVESSLTGDGIQVHETEPMEPAHYLPADLPEPYVSGEDEENEGDEEADDEEEEDFGETLPTLEEFILRVSRVTGAPDLTPQQYALVFKGIVNELQQISNGQKVYNTYQSSKAVSDWCAEQGENITRGDIVLIFKGIIFQDGVRFGKRPGSYTAQELAGVVKNNIRALCRRSRLELSEYEEHLLDEWIEGGLDHPTYAGLENQTDPEKGFD